MEFRFETLPGPQRALWPYLAPVSKMGFVLYGGTSVALRFGHRNSVDFDFFSSECFDERQLRDVLPWLCGCRKIQDAENTYSYITCYNAKISFLGGFNFGRIGCPDMDMGTGLQIASPEDVFALKLRAVHDRIAVKDLLDVAEFIRQGFSLEYAIMGANTLIKGMPPPEFTIRTLMWYDDPEFAGFSQENRDVIAKACAGVDLKKISGELAPLASHALQDEKLLQTFRKRHPDFLDK